MHSGAVSGLGSAIVVPAAGTHTSTTINATSARIPSCKDISALLGNFGRARSLLRISGRFGLTAVTKSGSKIACHNSGMRPMATIRARQRADRSVGYTAYMRIHCEQKIVDQEAQTFSSRAVAEGGPRRGRS